MTVDKRVAKLRHKYELERSKVLSRDNQIRELEDELTRSTKDMADALWQIEQLRLQIARS